MATEKERRFVLKYLPDGLYGHNIKQGYLILEGNKHLRVRIVDNDKCYITFKVFHSASVRSEYEYEIPFIDAVEMLFSTNIKLEKTRYKTNFEGNSVDIDIFSNGLQIVEIEYEKDLTSLPDYCGKEVTGIKKYSNIQIALNNS